jgi:hypothetical protein
MRNRKNVNPVLKYIEKSIIITAYTRNREIIARTYYLPSGGPVMIIFLFLAMFWQR